MRGCGINCDDSSLMRWGKNEKENYNERRGDGLGWAGMGCDEVEWAGIGWY